MIYLVIPIPVDENMVDSVEISVSKISPLVVPINIGPVEVKLVLYWFQPTAVIKWPLILVDIFGFVCCCKMMKKYQSHKH